MDSKLLRMIGLPLWSRPRGSTKSSYTHRSVRKLTIARSSFSWSIASVARASDVSMLPISSFRRELSNADCAMAALPSALKVVRALSAK